MPKQREMWTNIQHSFSVGRPCLTCWNLGPTLESHGCPMVDSLQLAGKQGPVTRQVQLKCYTAATHKQQPSPSPPLTHGPMLRHYRQHGSATAWPSLKGRSLLQEDLKNVEWSTSLLHPTLINWVNGPQFTLSRIPWVFCRCFLSNSALSEYVRLILFLKISFPRLMKTNRTPSHLITFVRKYD